MEFAISAYAPREPLVAKVNQPYDREQAQRHYLLAIGATPSDVSSSALRKAQRQGKSRVEIQGGGGARTIQMTSPLLDAICDRATTERNNQDAKTFTAVLKALTVSGNITVADQKHQKKSLKLPTSQRPNFWRRCGRGCFLMSRRSTSTS